MIISRELFTLPMGALEDVGDVESNGLVKARTSGFPPPLRLDALVPNFSGEERVLRSKWRRSFIYSPSCFDFLRAEVEADKRADAEREKQQLMNEIDEELKERKQELDEGCKKLSEDKGGQVGTLSLYFYP
uniref:Uncharacterized protein n=1 Tax=Parascaris equorum TaxID=6256 RepID=A0A914RR60_PAREQ